MRTTPEELLVDTVIEARTRIEALWQSDCPALLDDPLLSGQLEHALAVSPWFREAAVRCASWLGATLASGAQPALTAAWHEQQLLARQRDVDAPQIEADLQLLREHRERQMLHILWGELNGLASLEHTMQALSALADASIRVAEQIAHHATVARYGVPQSLVQTPDATAPDNAADAGHHDTAGMRLIVVAMGKLGGQELNVSSDIDLIYLYPDAGQTQGRRSVDNSEFFRRVGQLLSRLLGSVTEHGFVFRVDTRLRPFGESGPLAMSLDGFEHYLLTQGRDWERYAMVKARAVTGAPDAIERFEALRTPFVYRRYLDYSAIESLRELKEKISASVRRKRRIDDIKLGPGGIREVEFVAQAMQLIRGGREPRLRSRSLRKVLDRLASLELMSQAVVDQLQHAYEVLRRTENAVQALRDQQVHSLPEGDVDQCRVAVILGYPDWPACRADIDTARAFVSARFADLFDDPTAGSDTPSRQRAKELWALLGAGDASPDDVEDALRAAGLPTSANSDSVLLADELTDGATEVPADGPADARSLALGHASGHAAAEFASDEPAAQVLGSLCRGGFCQRLTARAQQRLDRLMPMIIERVVSLPEPVETLRRTAGFVRAVAGRSGYLQVLIDHPDSLQRLLTLFGSSLWLADFVTRHPIVIDELVGPAAAAALPERAALKDDIRAASAAVGDTDLETQMDTLRRLQQSYSLRIAVASLDGRITVMQTSDQLSWLAEAMLDAVLALVMQPLLSRHGRPTCLRDDCLHYPQVGVVAYGKLGGLELGFDSDLDVVFVHDSTGEQQHTDGDKPLDNSVFFARLAQRFISFMSTASNAGVLYPVDLRLRPNGQSGVLVTGIDSFSRYQEQDAWTWEHQALVRARMIVGSDSLMTRFGALRERVLRTPREPEAVRDAVVKMRRRMREHAGDSPPGQMHLKQDAGGVADIEFMVQYHVLAHAAAHPELTRVTDNVRLLESLGQCGVVPAPAARQLSDLYLALRRRMHEQALQQQTGSVEQGAALSAIRQAVTRFWHQLMSDT